MPKLTANSYQAILYSSCNSKVGCENPCNLGEKSPLPFSVVFLCPLFHTIFYRVNFVMAGLFEQSLRLVAPRCGILTSFNPVTNAVRSVSDGYFTNLGNTIMKFKSTGKIRPSNPLKSNHATALPFELLLKLNRQ